MLYYVRHVQIYSSRDMNRSLLDQGMDMQNNVFMNAPYFALKTND